MVVLKKIKSATLVEVIVASVLIVIIFMIASLVLNNLVLNTFSKNTHQIENRLNALAYELQNGMFKLPYEEKYKGWDITITTEKADSKAELIILAINEKNKKQISRQRIYAKQ
jgi:lipopolysaccharide export LptBFGC system permease protein LptF